MAKNRWSCISKARFNPCESGTPSVIRGIRKKSPPSQNHGVEREDCWKTPKRTVVLPPPKQITYSELMSNQSYE
ncbi:hypothetical protein TNCV_1710441 [Trichonephila clavipes]|nr:hypothetical protein TNCV_1710441 [Trichonephila clavipes]